MVETWYFRDAEQLCSGNIDKLLSETPGSSTRTILVNSSVEWARQETARSIAAGDWTVLAHISTAAGGGQGNKVRVIVTRRNSTCGVLETILDVDLAVTKDTGCQEYSFQALAHAQVDFAAGEYLRIEVYRSQGARDNWVCYDGPDPGTYDTKLIHPDPVSGATETLVGAQLWNEADSSQKAACDASISSHPKTEGILIHPTVTVTGGGSKNIQNKLQWRNKTKQPAGAWNDLGVQGPDSDKVESYNNPNFSDDAAHSNQHTCSPAGTFDAGASVYDDSDGTPNQAPNAAVSVSSGEFYVQGFAVIFTNIIAGDEYEFRLYSIEDSATIGTLACTVTILAGPTITLTGARIYDETDSVAQAACDGSVSGHPRTTPLVIHPTVTITVASKTTQNKLQWRNKTKQPAGSWNDLGANGPDEDTVDNPDNPNFVDDAAHANSHTCSPAGTFKAAASVYDDAGSNTAPNTPQSVAAGEFYVQAFALAFTNTILGDEYEFRLYDLDGAAAIGTLVCTITIESPGAETLGGAQFYNEADDTAEAACDTGITDHVKTTALLLHVTVNVTVASVDVQNKIQWRTKTKQPAGSWNDLDSAGPDSDTVSNPDNPNFADDAAHSSSHLCGESGVFDPGSSVYDDNGSNTAPNTKIAVPSGEYYVQAFAVGFSAGISGDEYEFRLYSIEKAAAIGTVLATVTLELVPTWGDYGAPILWEPNDYDPAPTPYFEAVLYTPNPGETAFARLYDKTADAPIPGSELQSTSQTPERKRSGALTFPSVDSELQGQAGAATGQTAKIKMARIIPKQVAT